MTDTPAPKPAAPTSVAPGAPVGDRYAVEAARRKLTVDQLFLLQTRNAIFFIAWVIGILLVLGAIVGIITAVQLLHLVHAVTGGGGGGSGYGY